MLHRRRDDYTPLGIYWLFLADPGGFASVNGIGLGIAGEFFNEAEWIVAVKQSVPLDGCLSPFPVVELDGNQATSISH